MGTKNKKGRTPESQKEFPGVRENVEQYPELTDKLKTLKRHRLAYGRAGTKAKEVGIEIREFMHNKKIPIYHGDRISVELEPGKEKLKITLGDSDEPED